MSVGQDRTGYWVVQRGPIQLAGALTQKAAEAERDLRERLETRAGWRHDEREEREVEQIY